ncbi:LysM peptidoglycan-binding domain-containing protein [Paenibacillus lycopersici]|uniref:LysM peptidoglycan-binding domain-containing protein n=1 Tax=Paenibacillus lycopersici TaxID=2704462 RepID=A0A6C0FRW1_9BACL|nr:LysM domain-containing protein [Paenibacillus lycopersici]QHT58812.1 LysM peptidoglycan-binding domain-containing protein [Paenibacillus lycopersici]
MQENRPTETRQRSRAARAREKKAGSSGIMLTTGAFLIVVCVILYGVYASHKNSGPKQLEAAKPPAADVGTGSGSGSGKAEQQGPSGQDAGSNASGGSGGSKPQDTSGGSADADNAGQPDAASGAGGGAEGSSAGDDGGANAGGQPDGASDGAGGANGSSGAKDAAGGTDAAKPDEPAKQPAETAGGKASSTSGQAAQSKLPTTYVVKKGDTLSTISLKFYHSKQYVAFLAQRNGIAFVNDMKVGDTIRIPALTAGAGSVKEGSKSGDYSKVKLPATYLVRPGDTLYRISVLFYQSGSYVSFLAKQNNLDEKEGLKAGVSLQIPAKPAAK